MKKEDIYDEGECWFDDPDRYGIPGESPMSFVLGVCSIFTFIIIMLKYVGAI